MMFLRWLEMMFAQFFFKICCRFTLSVFFGLMRGARVGLGGVNSGSYMCLNKLLQKTQNQGGDKFGFVQVLIILNRLELSGWNESQVKMLFSFCYYKVLIDFV
eukprot:TRINITY_DN5247_c0_g4_i1.p2 TRINITY_DN5247_c0_g4~~TRINITY_DN5247_c0_g4_i1.p2  ORF type:complete len:103 (-),score=3.58 TRINITY_DN5247_c0_g4_i1:145-453(-)